MRARRLLSVARGLSVVCSAALLGCGDDHVALVSPGPAVSAAALSGSAEPAAMQSLRAGLAHSKQGLVAEQLPGGETRVRLQGRFLKLSVVDAQGQTACVESPAALERMLSAAK